MDHAQAQQDAIPGPKFAGPVVVMLGVFALVALGVLLVSIVPHKSSTSADSRRATPMQTGSLTVHGPLRVDGDLNVSGTVTVQGPVRASRLNQARVSFAQTSLQMDPRVNHGPMSVGQLGVDGDLVVDGPLKVSGTITSPHAITAHGPVTEGGRYW